MAENKLALAINRLITQTRVSDECGIPKPRLSGIITGRAVATAREIAQLALWADIPPKQVSKLLQDEVTKRIEQGRREAGAEMVSLVSGD